MDNNVIPELVLDMGTPPDVVESSPKASSPNPPEQSVLSDAEKRAAEQFAQKIDVTNTNMVLMYGAEAQKKISGFSSTALNKVKTKDMGEVGGMLTNLVSELKGFSVEEQEVKGLKRLFRRGANSVSSMMTKYDSVEKNVDKITDELENHKRQLMKDIAMLDSMYDMNLAYYKELTMYIYAGKRKLEQVRAGELQRLYNKAKQTGLPEDAQAANDYNAMCDRFEKKLHDLELTRIISIQMGPQIRLVQNNDSMMVEKIQSSIINTIPLWKNQMVLALGLHHSREAIAAQREVTNMTNQLLKKNADMLKQGTIDATRESERGIVDVETLQYTNSQLISTLDEVIEIQRDGRQKRKDAERELLRIENELKNKLLELGGTK